MPTYNELRITTSTHIHLDPSAAKLGPTPKDLKPILQYQEQYLLNKYVQLPLISTKLIIHPGLSAAQLGLTPEDMEEVLADQVEWMREQEEEEQRADEHTIAEETHYQQQDHNRDNKGIQPSFPLLRHTPDAGNDMANNYYDCVVLFEHCNKFNNGSSNEELDRDAIKPPTFKPAVPGVMDSTWAEEIDRKHRYTLQGKYIQDNYSPVPSPAPWNPPHPLTSKHTHTPGLITHTPGPDTTHHTF
jgi:hypothetical protein